MSFFLSIAGRVLRLFQGTTAQVRHINPLFADGIDDGYSLPIDIPTEGNEEALQHVHVLPLRDRKLLQEQSQIGQDGVALFPGALAILGSTAKVARATFLVEALVTALRGVRLPDAVRSHVFDIMTQWAQGNPPHDMPLYADGGTYQLPMYYNPSLYGDKRPKYAPDTKTWTIDGTYALDDKVTYDRLVPVKRTWIYQCIAAAGANEGPETHPEKWQLTSYGMVNAWNKDLEAHYVNTLATDFYTWVPWFYLKWVVTNALASQGFRVAGTWMDDEASNEVLLANNTTMDAANPYVEAQAVRASQTTAAVYYAGPSTHHRIPADDDSTSPNTDTDSLWDTTAMDFECAEAGTYVMQFITRMNRDAYNGSVITGGNILANTPPPESEDVTCYLFDDTNTLRATQVLNAVSANDLRRTARFTITLGAGDVGRKFHAVMTQNVYRLMPNGNILSPTYANVLTRVRTWPSTTADHYSESQVLIWKSSAVPSVPRPDEFVTASRHMPDVELVDLLIGISDAFNVKVDVDMNERVVYMDLKERILENAPAYTTHHTPRLLGEPEMDHQRRIRGMRLKWDIERSEEEPEDEVVYDNETQLEAPSALGLWARIRNTRKLLKSAFDHVNGVFYWDVVGYYVPDLVVGETTDAKEVVPELKPLHMEDISVDDERYLVPVFDEAGTSAYYHCTGPNDKLYMTLFHKGESQSGEVTDVPLARSWGYGWTVEDHNALSLLWQNADPEQVCLFNYWRLWIQFLANADAVTMDLLLDLPFLLSREWKHILHLQNQHYLLEQLPVEYGAAGPLISRGAYAYRLLPPKGIALLPAEPLVEVELPPEYYFEFTVGPDAETFNEGTIETASGYYTVRSPSAVITTYTTGAGFTTSEEGVWRVWASNSAGIRTGGIDGVYIYSNVITALDLSHLAGSTMVFLYLSFCPITELELPAFALGYIHLEDVLVPTLDLSPVTALDTVEVYDTMTFQLTDAIFPATNALSAVQINSAQTQVSLDAALANLRANGFTGTANFTGGFQGTPSAAGIVDRDWMNANGATVTTN